MGINIEAGRDAQVKAGRDINIGARREILAEIQALLSFEESRHKQELRRIREAVAELSETDDRLAQETLSDRIMKLATSLGPAVVTTLGQLLPQLFD